MVEHSRACLGSEHMWQTVGLIKAWRNMQVKPRLDKMVFLHSILTTMRGLGDFIWSKDPDRPPSPKQELSRLTFTDHLEGMGQAHSYEQPFFIPLKYQNQLITMCYQKLFLGPGILVSRIQKIASSLRLLQLTIFLAHCHAALSSKCILRTECIWNSSRMLSYLSC